MQMDKLDNWVAPGAAKKRLRRTGKLEARPIKRALSQENHVVYFLAQGPYVKIGHTCDLERRLRELRMFSPVKFELLAVLPGPRDTEKQLHRKFSGSKVHGEWFEMTLALRELIDSILARGSVRPENQAGSKPESQESPCVRPEDRIH